ncbi:response regulator [Streptomyces sp. NPDC008150]|uniref:response regulator n=1 Tax=Streptomyces sp. NPDC008150 TaxID=3364816 RepID=UPI0036E92423
MTGAQPPRPATPRASGGPDPRPVLRVAVVEDEAMTTAQITGQLTALGLEVAVRVQRVEDLPDPPDGPPADVAVCDLHLPGLSGADAVGHLVGRGLPVVATTGAAMREEALEAIAAGARGFIEKRGLATDRFAAAALAVADGGCYADAHLAGYFLDDLDRNPLLGERLRTDDRRLLEAIARGDRIEDIAAEWGLAVREVQQVRLGRLFAAEVRHRTAHHLTAREKEVMIAVGCRGLTYKRAAAQLDIGVSTVAQHMENIRDKYRRTHPGSDGIRIASAATRWAWELGYCHGGGTTTVV